VTGGVRQAKGGACQYFNAAPYQVQTFTKTSSRAAPMVEISYAYNGP
jgi:hypothetical protein